MALLRLNKSECRFYLTGIYYFKSLHFALFPNIKEHQIPKIMFKGQKTNQVIIQLHMFIVVTFLSGYFKSFDFKISLTLKSLKSFIVLY